MEAFQYTLCIIPLAGFITHTMQQTQLKELYKVYIGMLPFVIPMPSFAGLHISTFNENTCSVFNKIQHIWLNVVYFIWHLVGWCMLCTVSKISNAYISNKVYNQRYN